METDKISYLSARSPEINFLKSPYDHPFFHTSYCPEVVLNLMAAPLKVYEYSLKVDSRLHLIDFYLYSDGVLVGYFRSRGSITLTGRSSQVGVAEGFSSFTELWDMSVIAR